MREAAPSATPRGTPYPLAATPAVGLFPPQELGYVAFAGLLQKPDGLLDALLTTFLAALLASLLAALLAPFLAPFLPSLLAAFLYCHFAIEFSSNAVRPIIPPSTAISSVTTAGMYLFNRYG